MLRNIQDVRLDPEARNLMLVWFTQHPGSDFATLGRRFGQDTGLYLYAFLSSTENYRKAANMLDLVSI